MLEIIIQCDSQSSSLWTQTAFGLREQTGLHPQSGSFQYPLWARQRWTFQGHGNGKDCSRGFWWTTCFLQSHLPTGSEWKCPHQHSHRKRNGQGPRLYREPSQVSRKWGLGAALFYSIWKKEMLYNVSSVGSAENIITNDPFGAVMSCFNKKVDIEVCNYISPCPWPLQTVQVLLIVRTEVLDWSYFYRYNKKYCKLWVESLSKCNHSHSSPFLCDLFLKISQGHLEGRLYTQFLSFHLGISFILQRRADRVPGTTCNRLCVIALQAESRLGFIDWLKLQGS